MDFKIQTMNEFVLSQISKVKNTIHDTLVFILVYLYIKELLAYYCCAAYENGCPWLIL